MDNKPLYRQIMDFIIEKVRTGEYQINQSIPTEMELAELFNVSRITSRRALDELDREGVIYRKRKAGSFVAPVKLSTINSNENASKIISLLLPFESEEGGMMHVVKGATEFLSMHNYYLTVHNTDFDVNNEKDTINKLVNDGVAGIIYYPVTNRNSVELLTPLCMNGFSIITIDKYFESLPISYVVSDNYGGAYVLTQHLLEQGHERIGFISEVGIDLRTTVRDRYLGYCNALRDHRLRIDNDIIVLNYRDRIKKDSSVVTDEHKELIKSIPGIDDYDFLEKIIENFLESGVTAIQAVNDIVAVHIEKVCLKMGVKIPEELAIVGFDNIDISEHIDVPLTTVEQNFYEMGKRAAQILIRDIREDGHEFIQETIPVKLIKRQSSMPLK